MQLRSKLLGTSAAAVLAGTVLAATGGMAGASALSAPGTHPAGSLGRMLPAPSRLAVPGVATGVNALESYNWSGYAQSIKTKGTFKAVRDYWTVPTVNTKLSGNQYSSDWVGIGGFNEDSLVQDGTEVDNINGTPKYDAWTEILPASEAVIQGLVIKPGDKMEGLVQETSSGVWQMTVYDLTTGKSGGKTVKYNSSGASVEAIHERPELGSSLSTLADTSNVTFDPGSFSIAAPGTPTWKPLLTATKGAKLSELFMTNGSAIIAAPSKADSDHDGFAVAYGSKSPPPPKS